MMKPEIFIAVKAMIATDPSVCGEQLDLVLAVLAADPKTSGERITNALSIMSGKTQAPLIMPLCKRREAAELLAVNIRTVDYYIRVGKLPCVKGSGNRVIGIPRESIIEMMTCRGEDPERAIR